jgi:hypothetical protein
VGAHYVDLADAASFVCGSQATGHSIAPPANRACWR